MNKIKMDSIQEIPYAVEESINRLRINVSFLGNEIKKIMVVSTLPNEGKSFVTMQIWKQMANAGIKSVLVDADMRNSVLVKKNDMERQDGKEMKGLTNYLAGDFSLDEVTYESPFENGDIIPNVENIINPSMLLEGDKFGNMLNELSKDYRYVFVDAPPLGLVSDAEKIGSMCDGAILVIRSGETTRAEVKNSIKQLERSGCKILGVVLNRATDLKNKYSKQKYYSGKY
ncbi:CpsD/CapB family tyrosine-protein kinase [Eubacterium sp. CAG:156]|uniref:CpsD/CapB family tyrosine-protein kinase n=1 Tax=Eubacterium sp. CAG:156 TaxID=1262880 RepID=UPI000335F400|nr:putative phage tail component domain protein [Eubacterium sp. CAG:156]